MEVTLSGQRVMQIMLLWLLSIVVSIIVTTELLSVADNCEVLYVAQDEIMGFETERIKSEPLKSRKLFFGKIDQAIKLATILPQSYRTKKTKIIYAESKISGDGVRSISGEIHQKIIERLREENGNKADLGK